MEIKNTIEFEWNELIIWETKTGKVKVEVTQTLLDELSLNKDNLEEYYKKLLDDKE